MTLPDDHLSPEEIARLADGKAPEEATETLLGHLYRCRSCMAAYVEAVRYRAAWLAAPDAFKPPEELVAAAHFVRFPAHPPRRRSRIAKLIPVAAGLVVLAIGARWALLSLNAPLGLSDPAQDALRSRSASGLLIPGVAIARSGSGMTMRGGEAPEDTGEALAAVRAEAERLGAGYRPDASSARQAYRYCATRYAANGPVNTNGSVAEALLRAPKDRALRLLDAAIAFQLDDLDRAEHSIAVVLQRNPGDALALLDLALVQQARGDSTSAKLGLTKLASRHDVIGERARIGLGARP
jgi:hypothetical protein